jgi:scyllo-inosamine-4-phosphate amidinotransferase 1
MKIHSFNEWDRLRSVVVGSAIGANWPSTDPVFAKESEKTTWTETSVPSGPVPQWIIDETEEDLEGLVSILKTFGAEVIRPTERDFTQSGGMYNYCPRDRLLIAGETIVDVNMMYPCRNQEVECLQDIFMGNLSIKMPRNSRMVLDAANICRLNDTWLFLKSHSGNFKAALWLKQNFPDISMEVCNFYEGVHIDSTIVPLSEDIVMVNANRVTPDNLPPVFKNGWEIIWVDDVVEQEFYQYPYASKWIGMNVLSLDDRTVIIDKNQTRLIHILESRGFTVIPHELRHARTLGGGYHCVTLDLWREN